MAMPGLRSRLRIGLRLLHNSRCTSIKIAVDKNRRLDLVDSGLGLGLRDLRLALGLGLGSRLCYGYV